MTHPYALPQHMKVVKHQMCLRNEVGAILNGSFNLNHYTILFVVPWEGPIILGKFQRPASWRM